MLKKLVKYGNSHALVLDRSILALLDIEEGSVVKLRIEGDALIIKAVKDAKPTDVMRLDMDTIHDQMNSVGASTFYMDIAKEKTQNFCKQVEMDPALMEKFKDWMPGTENAKKLEEAYGKIMQKYKKEMALLGSEAFQAESELLKKKYEKDPMSKKFAEEFVKLRLKHAPGLANMDKEMKEITAKMGYPVSW